MKQYIEKSAIVAEIERRLKEYQESGNAYYIPAKRELKEILSFLDTIEVKEVDLDFMLHEYWNISPKITIDYLESATMTKDEMINLAKHFFELGLNAAKISES